MASLRKYSPLTENSSYAEQHSDTGQYPFSRLLFCLEIESPDVSRAAEFRLVGRTLVNVAQILLVQSYCSGVYYRQ